MCKKNKLRLQYKKNKGYKYFLFNQVGCWNTSNVNLFNTYVPHSLTIKAVVNIENNFYFFLSNNYISSAIYIFLLFLFFRIIVLSKMPKDNLIFVQLRFLFWVVSVLWNYCIVDKDTERQNAPRKLKQYNHFKRRMANAIIIKIIKHVLVKKITFQINYYRKFTFVLSGMNGRIHNLTFINYSFVCKRVCLFVNTTNETFYV